VVAALEHEHLQTALRGPPGDGETNGARAYHGEVE
jgi:hypothetical protein